MATKAATKTKPKTEKPEAAAAAETPDSPLLDLSDAAVKKLIKTAKKRGYVTYEELNAVLPSEEVSPDQIEDIMAMFSDMGINVVDEDEVEEAEPDTPEEESTELAERPARPSPRKSNTREGSDRTDDPVRMYLREMGSVELLSREGEIAIAKRIEAGRETMIEGLCESPLTFQAIIIWRDQLAAAEILLRDIIDLEATYAGPDAKQAAPVGAGRDVEARRRAGRSRSRPKRRKPTPRRVGGDEDDDYVPEEPQAPQDPVEDDDDDFENSLSLSAMEAELKPQVVETFDRIAEAYGKMRKLQDKHAERDRTQAGDRRRDQEARGLPLVGDHRRQVAVAQRLAYREPRRAALRHQQAPGAARRPAAASRRELWHQARGLPRGLLRARARRRAGTSTVATQRQGLGRVRQARARHDQRHPRRDPDARDGRPASTSPSTAASSTRCRRASAKPRSPRRRWSRPTSAS